jgi:hypothetical protein
MSNHIERKRETPISSNKVFYLAKFCIAMSSWNFISNKYLKKYAKSLEKNMKFLNLKNSKINHAKQRADLIFFKNTQFQD